MTDLLPPTVPAAPTFAVATPGSLPPVAKRGMPGWGILIIVAGALAVTSVAFVVILSLTTLAGGLQPSSSAQGPAEPATEQTEAAEQPDDGVVYRSDEFGYQITFPGEPTESSVTQSVAGYDLEIYTATYTSGDLSLTVNTTEFPPELYSEPGLDTMLSGSLEGAAGAVGGTLENVEYLEIDGERAISGVIRTAQADVYVVVLFHDLVQYTIASVSGSAQQHDEFVGTLTFSG